MNNLDKAFDKKFGANLWEKIDGQGLHLLASRGHEVKKFIRQREKDLLEKVDGIVDNWPIVEDRIDLRRQIRKLSND